MRILFVTAGYLPEAIGGVELHVAGLCRGMGTAGHDCAVLARTGRPDVAHLAVARDEVDGVPVLRLGNTFEDARSFERMYDHPGIADAVGELVAAWKPDVVHVHHLTCLSMSVIDRVRALGIPVVMTLHDFWMGCPRGQRITAGLDLCPEIRLEKCRPCLRELWPHVLGRGRAPTASAEERDEEDMALLEAYHARVHAALAAVDRLVVPSPFMKRMYVGYGLDPGAIAVVENGLPKARWAAAMEAARAARVPAPDGVLRVGYVGSVIPSKGVHLLLEAVRRLGDPMGLRLDVWGEVLPFHHDTTYGERLAALRRGSESTVTLHGRYDNGDLPGILADLDVVVVPSLWYEAHGLTIREAFLAGLPVVASDHGALAEAVDHGRNGLLFRAGDSSSLAEVLRRLADAPPRRRPSGSPDDVRDEAEAAAELLGLYDRLVTGPRDGTGSPPPGGDRR